MTALLCTRRLFDALRQDDVADSPLSDETTHAEDTIAEISALPRNRLGDWTASLMPLRPARLILAISEHARLPLVLQALPFDTLPSRFGDALYALLLEIGVPPDLARLERAACADATVAAARSHGNSTLGTLSMYAVELRSLWENGASRSPAELSRHLAAMGGEHLAGATAIQATRRRFHLLPDRTEALGL